MAIFSKKVFPHNNYSEGIFSGLGTTAGSLSFIFSWLLHFIFSVAIGVFMFSIMTSGQHMAILSFAIAIPSMFLSGMILSVDIIAQSDVMQWISRFDPFRYTTGNLIVSATPRAQLGDLFQTLSVGDKRMIFKFGSSISDWNGTQTYWFNLDAKTGNILIQHYENNQPVNDSTISDAKGLKTFVASLSDVSKRAVIYDITLYKLLFENHLPIVGSSNNVFSAEVWGVRKLPDVAVIRDFVIKYFKGETGTGGDKDRFDTIWKDIKAGQYGWLDVFFKQNSLLYYQGDKVANLLVPIVVSGGLLTAAKYKFNWK